MRITRIEPLRRDEFPNIHGVEVHPAGGLTGQGEMFLGVRLRPGKRERPHAQRVAGAA